MFEIPDTKVFMDSVHGYIRVPKLFIDNLIDTEMFQRLRNIDQTGMRILYPNAKHDRFSHSLGVYHLGSRAVDALLKNFDLPSDIIENDEKKTLLFWAKSKVLFLIACLLHDVGHTPFSHAMESIVQNNSRKEDGTRLESVLAKMINTLEGEDLKEDIQKVRAAPHERIGALYILEHMKESVQNVLEGLVAEGYAFQEAYKLWYPDSADMNEEKRRENQAALLKEMRDLFVETLDQDLCFIARMILGLKYTKCDRGKQIRNCFVELLNGSNFDVDKMDYIIRDTRMSGISNFDVDATRILESVCIVEKTRYNAHKFDGFPFKNQKALELVGGADDDFHISGHFRGKLDFEIGAKVTIARGSKFNLLEPVNEATIRYAEKANPVRFKKGAEIYQDGQLVDFPNRDGEITLDLNRGRPFPCKIKNAELPKTLTDDFSFIVQPQKTGIVQDDKETKTHNDSIVMELDVNGVCDIRIQGKFRSKSPITCFDDVKFSGKINRLVALNNSVKESGPDDEIYNEYSVGFRKKAINVIANVLEARNYLYLWIYAHHKVIFYANFLLPVVAPLVLEEINSQFPKWGLNYQCIEYLDDCYVWTAIKSYYHGHKDLKDKREQALVELCECLLTRKYMVSLYKSMAEYDVLFEAFDHNAQMDIRYKVIVDAIDEEDNICVGGPDKRDMTAAYFKADVVKGIKNLGGETLNNITEILFVDSNYKEKQSDASQTLIRMNDGEEGVVPMSEIPLLNSSAKRMPQEANPYFYIYYKTTTTDRKQRGKEAEKLKEALKEYFKSELKKRQDSRTNLSFPQN